ncbi:hypothetical protein BC941DRAFT_447856 [Chlamydoabsidia padenii]|nr:hypothetical protein BC941DRAFT_447856 [Chlamydoabsidia padenii]
MDPSLDDNEWQTRMHIDPGTIFIPAYHVDDRTGQELYERLENLTSWETNNQILKQADDDHPLPPSHLVTRVTLYPDQKPFLEPWQFALIVIGVVVLTSLFIVLAVQCHLYRVKQRRHQEQHHHYEENDETDDQVNNESFWLQLLSAADNDDNYTRHHHQQQEKKPRYRLHPSVLDTLPTRQWDGLEMAKSDQCVICLEPFVVDDTLRTLPCEHEYHRDCIDVWLTKKNACCPLCLQLAITLPTIPEQVHHTHHHQNNSYTHEERLDHHHLWYDRTDQEDTPSSHTATTLTMPTRLSEVTSDPHQHQPPN